MPEMRDNSAILQEYVKLTEFLGIVLGSDYEVAFYDLANPDHSVIAIANGFVSGREKGAPLTNMALSILKDKSYEDSDYRINSSGLSLITGKKLHSNTFFVKHEGELIGLLSVNFDDSRYKAAASQVMSLINTQYSEKQEAVPKPIDTDEYNTLPEAVTSEAVARELARKGVTPDRLTQEERIEIIAALEAQGIFLLKGAVKDVASALKCSPPSIYRYIAQLKTLGGQCPSASQD